MLRLNDDMTKENTKLRINSGGVSIFMSQNDVKHEAVFNKFLHFMSLPDPEKCEMLGIPFVEEKGKFANAPTLERFADKFGVSRRTLHNWKLRKGFDPAVVARRREWGKDKTNNVMASLYRRCLQYGNAYDIELWLAYMEAWDRKQVIKHEHETFGADDIRVIIGRLPKEQQDEWYVKIGELISVAELHGSNGQVSENSVSETVGDQGEV